jgi:C-terminal processing protease CtpA/Prc
MEGKQQSVSPTCYSGLVSLLKIALNPNLDFYYKRNIMNNVCFRWSLMAVSFCFLLFNSFTLSANKLSEKDVTVLINKTLAVFSESYIDVAATPYVVSVINERLKQGAYKEVSTLKDFAEVIGRDIRNISGDVHLSLMLQNPNEPLTHILPQKGGRLSYNHAFEEVKYVHDNIGYLKFNKFHPSDEALKTADTAFAFLRSSDGLIIDMRDTVGGSPYLVQHMLSYFIEGGKVLWSVETNDQSHKDVIKVDTSPVHKRFLNDYPVWLLTSNSTASASELFAGVLQDYGKAKVVGSVTAGAGYYVGVRRITEELTFRISLAKPLLPNSNENWERVGITPDIEVEYVDAFDIALLDAIRAK